MLTRSFVYLPTHKRTRSHGTRLLLQKQSWKYTGWIRSDISLLKYLYTHNVEWSRERGHVWNDKVTLYCRDESSVRNEIYLL